MVGFVIWIVGLVLTIKAALEIWRIHAPIERRLIAIILIVLTSWIGLQSDMVYVSKSFQEVYQMRLLFISIS